MAGEIMSVAAMRAADQAYVDAGGAALELMERAGRGAAALLNARYGPRRALVACGPGDNGGDGYVAAAALRAFGWEVRVAADPQSGDRAGAAGAAAAKLDDSLAALDEAALDGVEVLVDALFGSGLTRPLSRDHVAFFKAAERRNLIVAALDLPSGLGGDRSVPLGYAPHVALTITFHRRKRAHVLEPARSFCGEVIVLDIGLEAVGEDALYENLPSLWRHAFPTPAVDAFKSRRGHLMVMSGGPLQTGAARLAARAGLRAGAGLVTLLCSPQAALVNAAHLEAVMLTAFEDAAALASAAAGADVAVIGPAAGVGVATREHLVALRQAGAALVVDADALTSFRDDPQTLFSHLGPDDVLTPHAGEFERIFPGLLKDAPERVAAVREAARRSGAVVLLKGPDTTIAAPDGRCAVNVNGSPWLATAGSGDVLAGVIGGFLAQATPAFEAACAGVFVHAAAGGAFGPGLIAEDLPNALPAALRQVLAMGNPGPAEPLGGM
jgi:hydroxyethylthiazole kinase-like uncharacterized protein yjeF